MDYDAGATVGAVCIATFELLRRHYWHPRLVTPMRGFVTVGLLLAVSLWSSGARADEITVAVATNFNETMTALAERFEQASGHTVLVSAGSTGNHYAQIRNGAPFDAFFSADTERPRLLVTQRLDFLG